MTYLKHPILGNKHVQDYMVPGLVSEGWVRFPRSKAEKEAGPFKAGVVPQQGVFSPPAAPAPTIESLRAVLEEEGFQYDKRWGLKRLQEAYDHRKIDHS